MKYHKTYILKKRDIKVQCSIAIPKQVVEHLLNGWPATKTKLVVQPDPRGAEARLLYLDCSKAVRDLKWRPTWTLEQTLDATIAWYKTFYGSENPDMYAASSGQIDTYVDAARRHGIAWATGD